MLVKSHTLKKIKLVTQNRNDFEGDLVDEKMIEPEVRAKDLSTGS